MSACVDVTVYIYIYINTRQPGTLSRDKIKRRNFSTVFLLGVWIFSSSLFFVVFAVVSWSWKCVRVCAWALQFLLGIFFLRIYTTHLARTLYTLKKTSHTLAHPDTHIDPVTTLNAGSFRLFYFFFIFSFLVFSSSASVSNELHIEEKCIIHIYNVYLVLSPRTPHMTNIVFIFSWCGRPAMSFSWIFLFKFFYVAYVMPDVAFWLQHYRI